MTLKVANIYDISTVLPLFEHIVHPTMQLLALLFLATPLKITLQTSIIILSRPTTYPCSGVGGRGGGGYRCSCCYLPATLENLTKYFLVFQGRG